jgi:Arc/MetJ-type ribon-helix-helix transcriptional regulator
MKVSISLPDEDLTFIDDYASRRNMGSRSSVLHRAIALLREADMESAYATAWDEWSSSGEAGQWEATVQDGATDAAR